MRARAESRLHAETAAACGVRSRVRRGFEARGAGCTGLALTVTRGELDRGAVAVTAGAWLDPDDAGCGALRTAGVCVAGGCDGVVFDCVVTGSGRICGSGSGLGVVWPNAGVANALATTTAPSAAVVRPNRSSPGPV
jgi:hypothetical protein